MGLCSSSPNPAMGKEEMAKNQQLEDQIARQRQKDKRINKLLLLGAGESGKSTFFKQIQNLYGKGFTEEERAGYTHIIQTNALSCMKTLCEQSDILNEEHGTAVDDALRPSKSYIEELKLAEKMDSDLAAHIKALWEDPGIKKTHNLRSKYQLNDSADYFFDRIEEIAQSDYLPTFDDICRVRVRTTGIVEMHFTADNTQFSMFDVGGQRNERKKWIHCFEDVTAVIFVAAVSAYDQVLFEDESQNRLQEAISLFSQISTSKWFLQTPIILFLNKKDLFAEKIGKAPLSICFPNYDGDNSYEDAMAYITDQFVETANGQRDGLIYTHETCATDSQNVAVIFTAVKDHIIRASLSEGGLLI